MTLISIVGHKNDWFWSFLEYRGGDFQEVLMATCLQWLEGEAVGWDSAGAALNYPSVKERIASGQAETDVTKALEV